MLVLNSVSILQRLLQFLANQDSDAVEEKQDCKLNDDRTRCDQMKVILWSPCPVVDLEGKDREITHEIFWSVEDEEELDELLGATVMM